MEYRSPPGGVRRPTPQPVPSAGRIPMLAWRQPLGGIRVARPSALGRR